MTFLHKIYNSYTATSSHWWWKQCCCEVRLDLCCAFYCPYLILEKFIYSTWLSLKPHFRQEIKIRV